MAPDQPGPAAPGAPGASLSWGEDCLRTHKEIGEAVLSSGPCQTHREERLRATWPCCRASDGDSWGLLVWLGSASAWGLGSRVLAQPEGAAESNALGKVLGSVSP